MSGSNLPLPRCPRCRQSSVAVVVVPVEIAQRDQRILVRFCFYECPHCEAASKQTAFRFLTAHLVNENHERAVAAWRRIHGDELATHAWKLA